MSQTTKEYPTYPNCPRCENGQFETCESNDHSGSSFMQYICCSNCHAIVGVIDKKFQENTNFKLKEIKDLLRSE